MWFMFALATMLCWGTADLFYKKGADESDRYSHLKITVIVGLVMGIHAVFTLLTNDIGYDFTNILIYLPVSSMYIISMTVGYFGLRYLELSISSPIQNSSGAVSCILCLVILGQAMDLLSALGVVMICLGVIWLGFIEKRLQDTYTDDNDKKYKIGFVAFMMPVIYCIVDALGTFFDAYYLDDIDKTPLLNVTEDTFELVANTSYELTFFICAVVLFIYIKFVKKQSFSAKMQGNRLCAAICETAGQFFYVYALSGNGVIAAPMIASYCIVSVILSRIVLKEKLTPMQYITIFIAIFGIILLGLAEGLAE